ncbi:MAG: AAA family ATPase [Treponema sp.]|nr:AAA family ATPase [Treponema sp.]
MLIHSIKLTNILSFGPHSEVIRLRPLNIIIGPNGSGKSNLLEAIDLLRNAPEQITRPVREGGGISDWLWKGTRAPIACLEAVTEYPHGPQNLRYTLTLASVNQRCEIGDEKIENEAPLPGHEKPYFFYHFDSGHPTLNMKEKDGSGRALKPEGIDSERSILAQRRDPEQYPEITYIAQEFGKIKLYREWSFGRYTAPRLPQKSDMPNDFLDSDGANLGLLLNKLRQIPETKQRILKALRLLCREADDFDVLIEGGAVQVFLQESGRFTVPATRLSDGTLRFLFLLVILCHPNPPPLVCIEEPELGLHPDILPSLADLLKEASERCQLIVTTHSDVLVDAMTDQPESVLVCEKDEKGTSMKRLNAEELKPWLEKYRLGELWIRGEIGGTRW